MRIWKIRLGWRLLDWIIKAIINPIVWSALGFGLFFYAIFLALKTGLISFIFFFKMSWKFGLNYSSLDSKLRVYHNASITFLHWHCAVVSNRYVFNDFLKNTWQKKTSYFKLIIYISLIRLILHFIEDFYYLYPEKAKAVLFIFYLLLISYIATYFVGLVFQGIGLLVYFVLFAETILLLMGFNSVFKFYFFNNPYLNLIFYSFFLGIFLLLTNSLRLALAYYLVDKMYVWFFKFILFLKNLFK